MSWAIGILLVVALITRSGDIAWMAVICLAYVGTGLMLSPDATEVRLSGHRSVAMTSTDSFAVISVTITLRNEGSTAQCLTITDAPPDGLPIREGNASVTTVLKAGEQDELFYAFEATRGDFSWRHVDVTAGDPFALFTMDVVVPAAAHLIIKPRVIKFPPLQFHPWNTLSSPGAVPTRHGGTGTDFHGVREYQPGDPLKALDWRMTARFPHTFFTREFVVEKTSEVALVLDRRQRMNVRKGDSTLLEREIDALTSLAELFLRQGHRVGLVVHGSKAIKILPDYGRIQLNRILNCLAGMKGEPFAGFDSLVGLSLRHVSRNAFIVIMSPLDQNDLPFFRTMRAQGYQVLAVSPDTFSFVRPDREGVGRNREAPLSHALRAWRVERSLLLHTIAQMNVTVVDWPVEEPLFPLLRGALTRCPRRRRA